MTKLTKLQTAMLGAAATAPDGSATAPTDAPEAKVKTAVTGLVKAGLMMSIPDSKGGPSRLLITDKGREICSDGPGEPPAPSSPETSPTAAPALPKGKLGVLVDLLRRDEGATIADMTAATGWQAHSVRGAMSGALKAKLKLAVISEKTEAGRRYRIAAGGGR